MRKSRFSDSQISAKHGLGWYYTKAKIEYGHLTLLLSSIKNGGITLANVGKLEGLGT